MTTRDVFATRHYLNDSTTTMILEKIKTLEENNDFLKDSIQKDLIDIAFKQMCLVKTIGNILRYIMLMLLTLILLNLGHITSVYETMSVDSIAFHCGETIVYGAMLIVIYILQKDLDR